MKKEIISINNINQRLHSVGSRISFLNFIIELDEQHPGFICGEVQADLVIEQTFSMISDLENIRDMAQVIRKRFGDD